jgi:heme-degrading monooxygenase HmoA
MFRVLLTWDVRPGMEADHVVTLREIAFGWNQRPGFRRLDVWQNAAPSSPQLVALEEWDDAAAWATWSYSSEEGSRDLGRLRALVSNFRMVPLSDSAVLPMPIRSLDVSRPHPERTHRS